MTELRKLDREIAERIFGAKVINRGSGENDLWEIHEHFSCPLLYYTFDHNAAWRAFEVINNNTLIAEKLRVEIVRGFFGNNRFQVDIKILNEVFTGLGKTIPEALTKAILEYSYNGIQNIT